MKEEQYGIEPFAERKQDALEFFGAYALKVEKTVRDAFEDFPFNARKRMERIGSALDSAAGLPLMPAMDNGARAELARSHAAVKDSNDDNDPDGVLENVRDHLAVYRDALMAVK